MIVKTCMYGYVKLLICKLNKLLLYYYVIFIDHLQGIKFI